MIDLVQFAKIELAAAAKLAEATDAFTAVVGETRAALTEIETLLDSHPDCPEMASDLSPVVARLSRQMNRHEKLLAAMSEYLSSASPQAKVIHFPARS